MYIIAHKTRGLTVVVLVTGPLESTPIDDVAYETFNAWGVGAKGKDDGVLLVVSPEDRKIRIETGKGVGGAITDVQASHINRDIIGPELANGNVYVALNRGTGAILSALAKEAPDPATPAPRRKTALENPLVLGGLGALVVVIIVLCIVSRTFRVFFFGFLRIFGFLLELLGVFRGGGGGGGGSSYGGGGGKSGGGGSSAGEPAETAPGR